MEDSGETPPRDLFLLPIMVGLAAANQAANPESDSGHDTLFAVISFQEFVDLDSLTEKSWPLPASKASIDAMPRTEVTESGKECSICLEEFLLGGERREMPCDHGFHSGCIEKWLGMHGSCPVCRYVMPAEEEDERRRRRRSGGGGDNDGGEGEDGGRGGRMILVDFWIRRGGGDRTVTGSDSDQTDLSRHDDMES